ncbi:MAG: Uncharacterized protein FD141_743 [Fusobacteria bacterium]|nr:MAG: Uncharacterized protein FD141_743 [Fusobacteriota bacterium]KAF0228591.1 MAG: hypothetical protein FD182_847 [Fusobacteriota bacterium]
MDRYLFREYILELEDSMLDNIYKFILTEAQEKVEIGNKGYYNFYPQEDRALQLIIETTQEDNKINLENMFFHHTSGSVWKLKIINALSDFSNTYMVSDENGLGGFIIRLVNEAVLGKQLKEGDIFEAQVSAFAINGAIHETENDYEKSIPLSKEGKRNMIADGGLMPLHLIINNNAFLSDEEIANKDHFKDNILAYKGTIESSNSYNLNMFDTDFPTYYSALINTDFGKLPIFFTRDFLNGMKRFGIGNIIEGELFLTGDVCIDDYNKYIKKNELSFKK